MKRVPAVTPMESDRDIEQEAARWLGRRDAGMTAAEQQAFETWRRTDPRHESAFARQEQAWRWFDRPASAGQADELVAALEKSQQRRRRRRRGAIAGAVVFIAALGALWRWPISPAPGAAPVAATRTGKASVILVESRSLPDGSTVELKPGAEIAVDFSGPFRRVTLSRGEGLFQVAKDAGRPFVVTAGSVSVRAVGTAFSVELGAGEVGVLVTEGRVAVERARAAAEPAAAVVSDLPGNSPATSVPGSASLAFSVPVDAGQRAIVAHAPAEAPRVEAVSGAELAERLAWRQPRLEFTATPLADAIALFNRYAPRPSSPKLEIDPRDPKLARLEVSGYFRPDNVEAFLLLIEQTLDVTSQRDGDRTILRRAR